jgi:hypothetical protein
VLTERWQPIPWLGWQREQALFVQSEPFEVVGG